MHCFVEYTSRVRLLKNWLDSSNLFIIIGLCLFWLLLLSAFCCTETSRKRRSEVLPLAALAPCLHFARFVLNSSRIAVWWRRRLETSPAPAQSWEGAAAAAAATAKWDRFRRRSSFPSPPATATTTATATAATTRPPHHFALANNFIDKRRTWSSLPPISPCNRAEGGVTHPVSDVFYSRTRRGFKIYINGAQRCCGVNSEMRCRAVPCRTVPFPLQHLRTRKGNLARRRATAESAAA